MIDRNVEFPNRFRMTKVEGTDDIYDLIPAPGEVIALGDTFSKANMLPDSIPATLGLKMGNPQVKDALNVLANIGNVHVWKRVQTYAESVPAGYTLGDEINGFLYVRKMGSANKYYEMTIQYGSNIGVSDDGAVYISDVTSYTNYPGSTDMQDLLTKMAGKYFKIVKFTYPDYFTSYVDELVYIPATATITFDSNINMQTDYQVVTGTPAIPAGTHVDYLTSTDPNAYPKQSAEGGQDAYYVLGDVVSGNNVFNENTDYLYWDVSDSVSVDSSGVVTLDEPETWNIGPYSNWNDKTFLLGKFVKRTDGDSSSGVLEVGTIYFIPADAVFSQSSDFPYSTFVSKYQPVTGYPAIPANTVITYLGQIGEAGARIEVGSYVGTGTYGSSNPNTLTFLSEPSMVIIRGGGYFSIFCKNETNTHSTKTPAGNNYSYNITCSFTGKTISWYNSNAQANQLNSSGVNYTYTAFA